MLHRSIDSSVLIYMVIVNPSLATQGIQCCIAATKALETLPRRPVKNRPKYDISILANFSG
ncbi:hypothetical protein [Ferribacterium limneticum]|uniref:hypothetical protein n=1 Tax=Ferribacterium limneticum TaxID=76259 RepID=UPI001CFBE860|nr:hypothetical protein [Ferribacterium limneticum]UCV19514.1 hypothetical protein KI610_02710 [Ferribacterium limneticum]